LFATCPDDEIGGGCLRGGALSVHNNVHVVMTDSVLEGNEGALGSGIVVEDSRVELVSTSQ
jgi:hypothetical protein